MDINDCIISILDFPKKGVIFKDITPLMLNPIEYHKTILLMAEKISQQNPTKIMAAESRGFFFGPAIAYELKLPFMPIRKPGKLPRQTIDVEYQLEYGIDKLCAHREDLSNLDRVAIIDDVLATGGTAEAMCKIVKQAGAQIACLAFFMELTQLGGVKRLDNYKVISIIKD